MLLLFTTLDWKASHTLIVIVNSHKSQVMIDLLITQAQPQTELVQAPSRSAHTLPTPCI